MIERHRVQHLQGRRHLPESGDVRPVEPRGHPELRHVVAARRDLLRRADVAVGAGVRHGACRRRSTSTAIGRPNMAASPGRISTATPISRWAPMRTPIPLPWIVGDVWVEDADAAATPPLFARDDARRRAVAARRRSARRARSSSPRPIRIWRAPSGAIPAISGSWTAASQPRLARRCGPLA